MSSGGGVGAEARGVAEARGAVGLPGGELRGAEGAAGVQPVAAAAARPATQPADAAKPADATQPAEGAQPVAGLGVDIIEIERMERALGRTPRMRERLFSQTERAYAQGKARPAVHFALFFAAKEAVLKALGTGFAGMAFTDVEVDHDRYGRPVPVLHGRARKLAEAQGIVEMQLSLSYTRSVGVASAVAIKEQDRPRKDERLDPRAELARQFKEVRALLDNMDERITQLDEDNAVADGLSAAPAAPAAPVTQEGTRHAAADDSQYAAEDDAQHAAEKETPHA